MEAYFSSKLDSICNCSKIVYSCIYKTNKDSKTKWWYIHWQWWAQYVCSCHTKEMKDISNSHGHSVECSWQDPSETNLEAMIGKQTWPQWMMVFILKNNKNCTIKAKYVTCYSPPLGVLTAWPGGFDFEPTNINQKRKSQMQSLSLETVLPCWTKVHL